MTGQAFPAHLAQRKRFTKNYPYSIVTYQHPQALHHVERRHNRGEYGAAVRPIHLRALSQPVDTCLQGQDLLLIATDICRRRNHDQQSRTARHGAAYTHWLHVVWGDNKQQHKIHHSNRVILLTTHPGIRHRDPARGQQGHTLLGRQLDILPVRPRARMALRLLLLGSSSVGRGIPTFTLLHLCQRHRDNHTQLLTRSCSFAENIVALQTIC